jgi:hypothetical protein
MLDDARYEMTARTAKVLFRVYWRKKTTFTLTMQNIARTLETENNIHKGPEWRMTPPCTSSMQTTKSLDPKKQSTM